VSVTLAVVAEPDLGAIAGVEGEFDWGTATTVAPPEAEAALAELRPEVVLALGDASVPGDRVPDLRWLPAPATASDGERVAAPDGEGLHSRAALPVRDELFELPAPDGGNLLVVSGNADRRGALVDELVQARVAGAGAESLTLEGLAAARAVAFLPEPGERSMPASAPAVLAARRVLIAPPAELTFGLEAGTDHLVASEDQHVLEYAAISIGLGRSLETLTVLGRVTAERHRASVVYGRLVRELTG